MRTVAALYIDPRGPYPKLPGVECWDAARDARQYAGPHPIVSHPPHGGWSSLRHLSKTDDKDCGPIAVEQVRRYGGVLEQPARSKLWEHCKLPLPGVTGLPADFGFSIAVEQVAWGHVARKPTWLWFYGVDPELVQPRVGGIPTHWCSGGHRCKTGGSAPPGIKICSAQQRRRSPPDFAQWLVSLARQVGDLPQNGHAVG